MHTEAQPSVIDEQVASSAPAIFALAQRLCVGCTAYHATRPYLRATGSNRGVTLDWPQMEPAAARLIGEGRRRVLIVGSGDAGITSLVLTAARGRPVAVTVIDRCATPLVQIQQLAARHGHRIRTLQDDLLRFDLPDSFDLVVGHQVLPFLPEGGRAMLRQAARALAPGGRLLIAVADQSWRSRRDRRFAERGEGVVEGLYNEVVAGLAAGAAPLPADRARFETLLRQNARERAARVPAHPPLEQTLADLRDAGLEPEPVPEEALPDTPAQVELRTPRRRLLVARARRHDAGA